MKDTLIQVGNNGMGGADKPLAKLLIQKYFELLSEEPVTPAFIVFYNEAVKLLCEKDPTLDSLRKIQAKGSKLIACSTCLNYFDLAAKQSVGISGSMGDIIHLQSKASKIITL